MSGLEPIKVQSSKEHFFFVCAFWFCYDSFSKPLQFGKFWVDLGKMSFEVDHRSCAFFDRAFSLFSLCWMGFPFSGVIVVLWFFDIWNTNRNKIYLVGFFQFYFYLYFFNRMSKNRVNQVNQVNEGNVKRKHGQYSHWSVFFGKIGPASVINMKRHFFLLYLRPVNWLGIGSGERGASSLMEAVRHRIPLVWRVPPSAFNAFNAFKECSSDRCLSP